MSQKTSLLSEVEGDEKLSPGTLAYLGERARNRYYDYVLKRFRASGLTKADLARRLGKGPDRINHLLGSPGNWTIDTIAELLVGISREELLPDSQVIEAKDGRNITQAALLRELCRGADPKSQQPSSDPETSATAQVLYIRPPRLSGAAGAMVRVCAL